MVKKKKNVGCECPSEMINMKKTNPWRQTSCFLQTVLANVNELYKKSILRGSVEPISKYLTCFTVTERAGRED